MESYFKGFVRTPGPSSQGKTLNAVIKTAAKRDVDFFCLFPAARQDNNGRPLLYEPPSMLALT